MVGALVVGILLYIYIYSRCPSIRDTLRFQNLSLIEGHFTFYKGQFDHMFFYKGHLENSFWGQVF